MCPSHERRVEQLKAQLETNEDLRRRLVGILCLFGHLGAKQIPKDAKVMVAEWKAALEESFLRLALQLFDDMQSLGEAAKFDFQLPGAEGNEVCSVEKSLPAFREAVVLDLNAVGELPKALLNLPIVAWLKGFVKSGLSEVLASWLELCELEGRRVVTQAVELREKSIKELLESLIVPARLSHAKAAAHKKFGAGGVGFVSGVGCSDSFAVLAEMSKMSNISTFTLGQPLLRDGSYDVAKDEVMCISSLVAAQNEAGCALLFLWMEVKQNSDMVKDHKTRDDITRALGIAETVCKEAMELFEADSNLIKSCFDLPVTWFASPGQLRMWFQNTIVVAREVRARMVQALVMDINSVALRTEKHTPKYQHFINATSFVRSLAKKHLLDNKNIQLLSNDAIDLFQGVSLIGSLVKQFDLPDPRKGDLSDIMSFLDLTYSEARTTLEVVAASAILLKENGDSQRDKAAKFLSRPKLSIPKGVILELQAVSGLSVTSLKRSASAANLKAED